MARPRKTLFRIGLIAVGALCALLLAEGMLRLGIIRNARQRKLHAQRVWEAGRHRVAILGDSFLAHGLGRMIAADLEDHGVGVHNLAVSGTGPFEYLERLQSTRKHPPPDAVLLGYYAGNDLTDVRYNPEYDGDGHGRGIVLTLPPEELPPSTPWYQPYVLDVFLRAEQTVVAGSAGPSFDWDAFAARGIPADLIEAARAGRMSPWYMELATRNEEHILDNILIEGEENRRAWRKLRELFLAIHAHCRARNMQLMLVVFPRSVQIDDSHFEFYRKLTFAIDERTLSSTRPQDLAAELGKEAGIPVLDLLPALEAADRQLYLPLDHHFSEEGERFAADRIVPFVLENLR